MAGSQTWDKTFLKTQNYDFMFDNGKNNLKIIIYSLELKYQGILRLLASQAKRIANQSFNLCA